MGLIKAALGSVGGVMADQWKEYFYCEAMPDNVLAIKGQKRVSGRSSNTKGSDNVITNGSVIAVADGQCMMIVDQGRIIEVCAEPGEFTYDMSTEPSLFTGELKGSIRAVIDNMTNRFTFGGEPPKDQRIYYFNTKELMGNKYGTPSPVPFRVVDQRAGIDMDVGIRCFGEYSYRITNPVLFYTNVCGILGHCQSLHIPLDRLHAQRAHGGDYMIVILAVGAADQRGTAAGDGFDLVAAGFDVRDDLGGTQAVIVVVMVGMAHDLVPCVMQRFHGFRVLIHPVAHHEKSGFHVVFCQNINQMLRILISPRSVEGDGAQSILALH